MASFAPSYRWADVQSATPSFMAAQEGTGHVDQIPVPQVLDSSIYNTPSKSSGAGGAGGGSTIRRATTPGASGLRTGASPRTTSAPRLRPLHEDLIERGKMYEHRKEAMREHALRKELATCRDVPLVSPMARAIQREPNRIIKRLYNLAEEREKIREYKNQAMVKEDQERLDGWFKPAISSLGNRANTTTKAVRHQQWEQKKQERLAEHRRNILLKELQHVRNGPEINPRSEALAARAREREGLGNLSHIEAMMERDRMAQLHKWETEQRHLSDEAPGTPRITAMAARMHAKTDIFDRLYAMTPPRYNGRAGGGGKEAPNPDDLVNDVTRPFQQHTPVITAEAIKRFSTDGGLLERQEAYLQKKRERLRRAQEDENRLHNPNIDPMSARIAAALPETSETRLTSSNTANSRRLSSSASMGRATTPTPSSNNNNNFSRQNTNDGQPTSNKTTANELAVYERAVVAEMRRQQRLQKAREEHRQKQLQDCTFQPETTGAAAKVVGPASTPLERMAQRSAEWAKKRDEKLSTMRSQEEHKETEDCTFQPHISHPQLRQFDSPLYGGDGKPWGVNEYIQRQEAARRAQAEREGVHLAVNTGNVSARPAPAYHQQQHQHQHHQQNNSSNNNHNNTSVQNWTTPHGPNLGNYPAPNIPSLDPPVRPPNHDVASFAPQGQHHQGDYVNSTAASIANQYMRR